MQQTAVCPKSSHFTHLITCTEEWEVLGRQVCPKERVEGFSFVTVVEECSAAVSPEVVAGGPLFFFLVGGFCSERGSG